MTSVDAEIITKTDTRIVMREPGMFNVVLYNDDSTTVEFVILILMNIFYKSFDEASKLTLTIHDEGKGIAGTYTHEVADQKCQETIFVARSHSFPLQCKVEAA